MKRLFSSGIVTTCLGLALIGLSAFLYFSLDHSETEGAAVAALGLMFLRSKDSLIGLGKDAAK